MLRMILTRRTAKQKYSSVSSCFNTKTRFIFSRARLLLVGGKCLYQHNFPK